MNANKRCEKCFRARQDSGRENADGRRLALRKRKRQAYPLLSYPERSFAGRDRGDVQKERHRFLGPNVRHERRRKGREAAFGTSARWRGQVPALQLPASRGD